MNNNAIGMTEQAARKKEYLDMIYSGKLDVFGLVDLLVDTQLQAKKETAELSALVKNQLITYDDLRRIRTRVSERCVTLLADCKHPDAMLYKNKLRYHMYALLRDQYGLCNGVVGNPQSKTRMSCVPKIIDGINNLDIDVLEFISNHPIKHRSATRCTNREKLIRYLGMGEEPENAI